MAWALLKPAGELEPRTVRLDWRPWVVALVSGCLAAAAAIALAALVGVAEFAFFGSPPDRVAATAETSSTLQLLAAPLIGGVAVALLLWFGARTGWGDAPLAWSFSDVVRARRWRAGLSDRVFSLRGAVLSALIVVASTGAGGSLGRAGAAAHFGASLAIIPARLLRLDPSSRRLMIACGVAAALAATLQAPLAAALLAQEVILARRRLVLFGPVALASTCGWLMSVACLRAPLAGFSGPEAGSDVSLLLLAPGLGLLCALVGLVLRHGEGLAANGAAALWRRLGAPVWTLPILAGALLGVGGLAFPQILGQGLDIAAAAGTGTQPAVTLATLAAAKAAAILVCFAGRFGGGTILPAICLGALAGGAFGAAIDLAFGLDGQARVLFAGAGLGVALAATLDAPLTGVVLVLEATGSTDCAGAALIGVLTVHVLMQLLPPLHPVIPDRTPTLKPEPVDAPDGSNVTEPVIYAARD